MNSNAEKLIEKLKGDADFQKKIAGLGNKEQVVEAAKAEGIQLSVEDIDAVNIAMQREMVKNIDQSTPAGQFLAKMLGDKEFAERVMIQTEEEEVLGLAKGEGISLTVQDLEEVNQTLAALASGNNAAVAKTGELSEEDLEQVAGGFVLSGVTISIVTSALTVSALLVSITGISVASLVATIVSSAGSADRDIRDLG